MKSRDMCNTDFRKNGIKISTSSLETSFHVCISKVYSRNDDSLSFKISKTDPITLLLIHDIIKFNIQHN